MSKEELKVAIIIKHNGKDVAGIGADYSEFFQDGQKLTRQHVIKTLTSLCRSTTAKLQRMKLVHPYIDG